MNDCARNEANALRSFLCISALVVGLLIVAVQVDAAPAVIANHVGILY
jgi:hypothetical protein